MASTAVARETVFALRREIAKIEGRLAERLEAPGEPLDIVRRVGGSASTGQTLLSTGARRLDMALGGGLQANGLTEIHTSETRDAASAAGFAMALCARMPPIAPVLWIGTADIFHEAGLPYAPGIGSRFGIAARRLLVAQGRRVEDALWIAGEAAGLPDLAAVVLELRGSPEKLGLTATRSLHRRALLAGRPVFLLRQTGLPQPTAACTRLLVGPAPATVRQTLAGPLSGTIGHSAFVVTIAKGGLPSARPFTVEWKPHELSFGDIGKGDRAQDPGDLASQPGRPARVAASVGSVLAFASGEASSPRHQPHGIQRKTDIGARRTG